MKRVDVAGRLEVECGGSEGKEGSIYDRYGALISSYICLRVMCLQRRAGREDLFLKMGLALSPRHSSPSPPPPALVGTYVSYPQGGYLRSIGAPGARPGRSFRGTHPGCLLKPVLAWFALLDRFWRREDGRDRRWVASSRREWW